MDGTDGGNGYNLSLQAASPCIDTGTSSGAPGEDILGVTRPQGTGVDMGAYEYEGGGSGGNNLPVVNDDAYSTDEDTTLNVAAPGVLSNDTDADSLTATLVAGPTHGTLTLNADGSFTYTPDLNFNGTDSFTYKANDGTADSAPATVTIEVGGTNDPPVAFDDAYSTDEDTTLTVDAPGVLGNDTDADDDPLTAKLIAGPSSGVLKLNTDGSFTYTPDLNFNGPDSFTYKAYDGTAYSDPATVSITVVGVNTPPEIDDIYPPIDPMPVNTLLQVGADFTDPDVDDTHTAQWDWGDGDTSTGEVTVDDEGYPIVFGSHLYSSAGVYTVGLTLRDAAGEPDTAVYQYVVIYDPSGGFVTGGGWIDSLAGAYVPDASLSGKATFGFVSKYKKGATVPSGSTEFQFKAGDLNFHSTSYDWLVVTGADYAQFKGAGDIDGFGSCKFKLWAGDGASDTFRIKMWTEYQAGVEHIIYDNGFDQDISGGSIVVHAK